MGKVVPLVSETALDRGHLHAWNRMERHVQLVFWLEEQIELCRRLCPPQSRREFLEILRYLGSDRFPLTESALRCALICLRIIAERYEKAA